jgi:serine protease
MIDVIKKDFTSSSKMGSILSKKKCIVNFQHKEGSLEKNNHTRFFNTAILKTAAAFAFAAFSLAQPNILSAQENKTAAKRYIIIYKSEQGFKSMNQFMKTNSSFNQFGLVQSLENVQNTIIRTANLDLIAKLKNHPEISDVIEEYFFPPPRLLNGAKLSIRSDLPEAEILNENANPDSFVQTEGTPWGIIAVKAPSAWGISDAGSQSRVLVVDTGIDMAHVALRKNIEKAKNFVAPEGGGSVNPSNVKDDVGHGTHVAGTIAGQYNDKTGFVGVAPKAKILAGKVCTLKGCSPIDIAAAIDWGVAQKVDVINMSLGMPASTGNPIQDLLLPQMVKPIKEALAKAEKAGVFTVAASGNSATEATDTAPATNPKIGAPASIATVYAVGALSDDLKRASFSQYGPELDITAPGAAVLSAVPMQSGRNSEVYVVAGSGQKTLIKSASFAGTKEITVARTNSLVYCGMGKPGECPASVAGKFALISRGEQIPFADKIKTAQAAKAVGVVFFNNAEGLIQGTVGEGQEIDYPVVMIEQVEGEKIVALLKQGQVVRAQLATVKSDYSSFEGTSMASPHVAGVAALAISAFRITHPGKAITPAQLRAILTRTAQPILPNTGNMYGAGLVRADGAAVFASKLKVQ